MRFFGLCLILLVIGLATACGGAPAATTSTLPTVQTVTCTVFATREGLVGRTTANGHVIQPTGRFVALPSRSVLASAGGNEFQVRITYKNTTMTVPVWDVGPWNTEDNYWDPSEQRLRWKDLPQCRPEAQAAYEAKYNDGKDQSGRQVKNPAGIDLSDGTWSALGMTYNDKVVVEYLWTKGSGATGTGASATTQRPAVAAAPSPELVERPAAAPVTAPVAPAVSAPAAPIAAEQKPVANVAQPSTSKGFASGEYNLSQIKTSSSNVVVAFVATAIKQESFPVALYEGVPVPADTTSFDKLRKALGNPLDREEKSRLVIGGLRYRIIDRFVDPKDALPNANYSVSALFVDPCADCAGFWSIEFVL